MHLNFHRMGTKRPACTHETKASERYKCQALRYRCLRVWEVPAKKWLSGGLGLLPLAPLGDVEPGKLPAVIAQMKQRLDRTLPDRQKADLWSA